MSFKIQQSKMFGKVYFTPVNRETGAKLAKGTPVGPGHAWLRGMAASKAHKA